MRKSYLHNVTVKLFLFEQAPREDSYSTKLKDVYLAQSQHLDLLLKIKDEVWYYYSKTQWLDLSRIISLVARS